MIGSGIPGDVGMLGEDYPGYYPVGDERASAGLLRGAEKDGAFYAELTARYEARRHQVAPGREKAALEGLLEEVRSRAVA